MRTTALHQGLLLGQIAPACNMSFTCVLTFSNRGGWMHLNRSLKGSSSVTLILCLTWLVHPSSLSSREKTSWYSLNNLWVHSAFSAGHLSKPERSRLAISFSWHSATLRVGLGFSNSSKYSCIPSFNWGCGTSLQACTQATFWPFPKWIGNPIMLHSTTGMVLLPCLSTV